MRRRIIRLKYSTFRILLCILLLVISSLVSSHVAEVSANDQTATINVPTLNSRQGPGLSYDVIRQVKQGEQFSIIEKKNDWVKVQLSTNRSGWLASWLIKENTNEVTSEPKSGNVTITVDGLRIRTGPGTSFQVIGFLDKGQKAKYIDKNENWTKIFINNKEGWISSNYLSFEVMESDNNSEQKPSPPQETATGKISATILNVRSEPSLEGPIVGKLKSGDSITIVNEREDWLEITFNDSKAWISRDFVDIDKKNEPNKNEKTDIPNTEDENNTPEDETTTPISAKVTASILNVRDKGSLASSIISKVAQGDVVLILQESNQWYEIELPNKSRGWVAGWYLEKIQDIAVPPTQNDNSNKSSMVRILQNGSNVRSGPSTSTDVVMRVNEGESFEILTVEGDWFKIKLPSNKEGYIAGWIVETSGNTPNIEKPGVNQYLKYKTIVIDPGHGGRDSGTIGVRGTLEKEMTLRTSKLLFDKLNASGANVILTRNSDVYVSLRSRVSLANYRNADAFISIHYDSVNDRSVNGITSYFYKTNLDAPLASAIQKEMIKYTNLKDRGPRSGNYHVIRENKRPAALLELGFLSNSSEELTIGSSNYQENVSNGIFYGLAQYFKAK